MSRSAVPRLALAIVVVALGSLDARAGNPDPMVHARLWLKALREGKSESLASLTSLPFAYREAWPRKQCTQEVKKADGLLKWLSCVRKNEQLLLKELEWADDPNHVVLRPGMQGASAKLRSLVKTPATEGGWVNGFINGDGVTYEFVFHLEGDDASGRRVSAFFIDASFESG